MTWALELNGVAKRFGLRTVLAGVDLRLAAGDHVTLRGANGAGKTTLLRIAAGLTSCDAGTVSCFGSDPRDADVRRRIGFIGHAPALYERLTASENLAFWARLYGVDPSVVAELLGSLGLDPADQRTVDTYSQGMRQRVAIARALCTRPDFVLADEPLAALDAAGADQAAALLAGVETVVMVTHGRPGGRGFELVDGTLR